VTNVLKHARAGQMDVRAFTRGNQVAVEISDDGVGFAPETTFGRGLNAPGGTVKPYVAVA